MFSSRGKIMISLCKSNVLKVYHDFIYVVLQVQREEGRGDNRKNFKVSKSFQVGSVCV